MGYLHVDNHYKSQDILNFKTCFALEKIHGSSAHIRWFRASIESPSELTFFSGGTPHAHFTSLFDQAKLVNLFEERFGFVTDPVTVFGEAYGGRCQGMSGTYGTSLKFIAFDVQVNDKWLAVPQAAELVAYLGLEFVDYAEIPTTLEAIDAERDKPSIQAVRNGILEPKIREGIVLRPPFEVTLNHGRRLIAKHKRIEFSETATHRPVSQEKQDALTAADAIVAEWVTAQRL